MCEEGNGSTGAGGEPREEDLILFGGEKVRGSDGGDEPKEEEEEESKVGWRGGEESRYPGNSCCSEGQMALGGAVMAAAPGRPNPNERHAVQTSRLCSVNAINQSSTAFVLPREHC